MSFSQTYSVEVLQAYLQDEHRERKKTELDLSDWNFGAAEGIPKQLNGSDCGVFVCKFAEYLAERRTLDWDGRDMPRFREEMALVLANYRN
jgi:sentrin-specific protease 1